MGEPFGTLPDGTAVTAFRLRSDDLEVTVLDHGGVVQSVLAPDRDGDRADVVLGFDAAEPYATESPYFGALVGRYANRIANARFPLNGREYQLQANDGPNTLHGGPGGFDKQRWDAEELGATGVRLSLVSPDGDEGFPGRLAVTVTYTLTGDSLRIDYEARNEEAEGGPATVVNLTNHSYWNLAGEGSGSVAEHELRLSASRYTPVDATSIPTGELATRGGDAVRLPDADPGGRALAGGARAAGPRRRVRPQLRARRRSPAAPPERDGLGLAAVVRDPGQRPRARDLDRPARRAVLLGQPADGSAARQVRPALPRRRRAVPGDPALPGLAQPPGLPLDAAPAAGDVPDVDGLPAHDGSRVIANM